MSLDARRSDPADSDPRRRARREAARWQAREDDRRAALEREQETPEERATALLKNLGARVALRPADDAPASAWATHFARYPNPFLAELGTERDDKPDELPFTRAELSLGEILDALREDDPWLARLTFADEGNGRVHGDVIRLLRWSGVLVDMHFAESEPEERAELKDRYFARVKALYWGGEA